MKKGPQLAGSDRKVEGSDILVHRDGHEVKVLDEGVDEGGDYLVIRHTWTRPGPMVRRNITRRLPRIRSTDGTRVLLCEQVQDVSSSLMALAIPTQGRGDG